MERIVVGGSACPQLLIEAFERQFGILYRSGLLHHGDQSGRRLQSSDTFIPQIDRRASERAHERGAAAPMVSISSMRTATNCHGTGNPSAIS
jgi:hypothetical protein